MTPLFDTHEIPISAAFFVSFFEGQRFNDPHRTALKFGCAWPFSETPDNLTEFVNENDFGLASGLANARPVITEASGDYALLREKLELAELRNISRDRLFSSMPMTLVVNPWRLDPTDRHRGLSGLAVIEVIVDARKLEYRPFLETPKRPKP